MQAEPGILIRYLNDRHILVRNSIKQDEVKENAKRSNSVKRVDRIIKRGISYYNILPTVVHLLNSTNNTEESTDSILQAIIYLSSKTLNEALIHMSINRIYFHELNNQTVAMDNERISSKDIIK